MIIIDDRSESVGLCHLLYIYIYIYICVASPLTLDIMSRRFGYIYSRASVSRSLSIQSRNNETSVRVRDSLSGALVSISNVASSSSSTSIPLKPLSWYACGPTVYDDAHVGHARTYVTLDMLRRVSEGRATRPINFALGVTDIDDKIVARARADGVTPPVIAARFEAAFFADLAALRCRTPTTVLRVSEHVPDIIAYALRLVNQGAAYVVPRPISLGVGGDTVFLDVRALGESYGKLAPRAVKMASVTHKMAESENMNMSPNIDAATTDADAGGGGGNVDAAEGTTAWPKRDARDFALWRGVATADVPPDSVSTSKSGDGGRGEGSSTGWAWQSPWGIGRPGWHLECSAMTRAHFGDEPLDLHAGGIDLAFPHHCNECAQVDALVGSAARASGWSWVRAWVHTGHVHVAGRKMSKSLKNFITVREMLAPDGAAAVAVAEAGLGGPAPIADAFRLWCAGHAYGASLTYSPARLGDAAAAARRFDAFLSDTRVRLGKEKVGKNARETCRFGPAEHNLNNAWTVAITEARAALSEDFDTPRALRALAAGTAVSAAYSASAIDGRANGLLASIARELALELSSLGLAFAAVHAVALETVQVAAAAASSSSSVEDSRAIEALVGLRERLRVGASGVKKLNASGSSGSESSAALASVIFKECDVIRDQTLPSLGWTLKDAPSGPIFEKRGGGKV